ncbi:MAG TPA: arginase family protein [Steroidobacteraceae bacterium]|nr:arginase family protein [Steroidobacteraceae bacterium]
MRIQLLGLPTDVNSSYRRGAAQAPGAIRRAWQRYQQFGNATTESGLEVGGDLQLEDLGDLALDESPDDHARIAAAAATAAARGPLLSLGGDHSVTFPLVEGLARVHGPLNLLHFDAHPDLYDDYEGNPRSHASPFARILERGLARRLVQVGVRTWNAHNRAQARRFGVEVVEWDGFAVDRVPIPDGPLYVTIDLDALDPAFAPAVSHPEPGGLSVRDVVAVLARIRTRMVGADVVELNPTQAEGDATAIVAVKLMKELAAAMGGMR